MAKMIANTTLSFEGQQVARAGKEFEGKELPAQVLEGWAAKGWCSLNPGKKAAKSNQSRSRKVAEQSIRETN